MSDEERTALADNAVPELKKVLGDLRNMGLPDPLGKTGPHAVGGYFDSKAGALEFAGSGGHYLDDLVVKLDEPDKGAGPRVQEWRGAEAVAFLQLVKDGVVAKRAQVDQALQWADTFKAANM